MSIDVENNNTRKQAVLLNLTGMEYNAYAGMSVSRLEDVYDYYKFYLWEECSSDDYISVVFDSRAVDIDIILMDENGKTLARSSGSTGGEKLSLEGFGDGFYYLCVGAFSGAGQYTMTIQVPEYTPKKVFHEVVSDGEILYLYNKDICQDITVEFGGNLYVYNDVQFSGSVNIAGFVTLKELVDADGASFCFDLTKAEEDDSILLNDISLLHNAKICIIISDTVSNGTYQIAGCGNGIFTDTVSVLHEDGTLLGQLSAAKPLVLDNREYTIACENQVLTLTISGKRPEEDTAPYFTEDAERILGDDSCTLFWKPAEDDYRVLGYVVSIGNKISITQDTTFTADNLEDGFYRYQINAFDDALNFSRAQIDFFGIVNNQENIWFSDLSLALSHAARTGALILTVYGDPETDEATAEFYQYVDATPELRNYIATSSVVFLANPKLENIIVPQGNTSPYFVLLDSTGTPVDERSGFSLETSTDWMQWFSSNVSLLDLEKYTENKVVRYVNTLYFGNLVASENIMVCKNLSVIGFVFGKKSSGNKEGENHAVIASDIDATRFFLGGDETAAGQVIVENSVGHFETCEFPNGLFGGSQCWKVSIYGNHEMVVSNTKTSLLVGGDYLAIGDNTDNDHDVSKFFGDINLSATDSEVTTFVIGGSIVSSYAEEKRSGNINITLRDGTYNSIVGGSFLQSSLGGPKSYIVGDINLTISGDVHTNGIYTAGGALKDSITKNNAIILNGNSSLTIHTGNGFSTSGVVTSGGLGYASVTGNTELTIVGTGFQDNYSALFTTGDSTSAYGYKEGTKFVSGQRKLAFRNFSGIFETSIGFFDIIEIDETSEITTDWGNGNSANGVLLWNISADSASRRSFTCTNEDWQINLSRKIFSLECALDEGEEWVFFQTAGLESLCGFDSSGYILNGEVLKYLGRNEDGIETFESDTYRIVLDTEQSALVASVITVTPVGNWDLYEEYTRNDTIETASELGVLNGTQTISNLTISYGGDVDYYKFELTGTRVGNDHIQVDYDLFSLLQVSLCDENGNTLQTSSLLFDRGKISLANLSNGTYYVKVSSLFSFEDSSYSLSYQVSSAQIGISADSYEGREPIVITESTSISNLSIFDDGGATSRQDTFRFTLNYTGNATSKITFSNYRTDWNGLAWTLTNAENGEEIKSGIGDKVSLNKLAAGTYTLVLDTPVENQNGNYDISISLPDQESDGSELADTWTVLIYIDGDNNLDPSFFQEISNMQRAVLDENVNVCVLYDRSGDSNGSTSNYGYDFDFGFNFDDIFSDWFDDGTTTQWSDTRVCQLNHESGSFDDIKWNSWGELDVGDINTLESFISWGMEEAPAEKYALVLGDHGTPFGYICKDETTVPTSMLKIEEISSVVDKYDITLTIFDACQMGTDIVLSEMSGKTDYVVASEAISWSPDANFCYQTIFDNLKGSTSVEGFAKLIVDSMDTSYGETYPETLGAFRTGDDTIFNALCEFGEASKSFSEKEWKELVSAFEQGNNYTDDGDITIDCFSDLFQIFDWVNMRDETALTSAIRTLEEEITDATIAFRASPRDYGTGIAIFNPILSTDDLEHWIYCDSEEYHLDYSQTKAGQSSWGEFLNTLYTEHYNPDF